MKTRDLIKQLQEEDPSGDMDVTVGNQDIWFISPEPAYWDGCKQVLIRDENKIYYGGVIGVRVCSEGDKLVINPFNIRSAIWDNTNFLIEYDSKYAEEYKEQHQGWRQEAKNDV